MFRSSVFVCGVSLGFGGCCSDISHLEASPWAQASREVFIDTIMTLKSNKGRLPTQDRSRNLFLPSGSG